jgi:hypothetical protein
MSAVDVLVNLTARDRTHIITEDMSEPSTPYIDVDMRMKCSRKTARDLIFPKRTKTPWS